jgi:hypothetical protein
MMNKDHGPTLAATNSGLKPGDFPLGSAESRAAARALLGIAVSQDCICFPADEPPQLELKGEIEAAKAVRCPVHGERFSRLAPMIWRAPKFIVPAHLQPESYLSWHSTQYRKALKASFPPDRFPATEIEDPDGVVRFMLKDGTEMHRLPPPTLVLDYETGKPCGWSGRRGQMLPLDTYPLKEHSEST